jgi:hypothetical protein
MKPVLITHDSDIVQRPQQIQQPHEMAVLTEPFSVSLADTTYVAKHGFNAAVNIAAFMAYCI